jgi:Zn-dependent membrane protease YugP
MTLSLIFLLTLVISLLAMWRVKSAYARLRRMPAASGYSGAEAAAQILAAAGIHDVEIVQHEEPLGDHYDPQHRRLVLSADTYDGRSVAALGIAAHECGHAIQHHRAYQPLIWRMAAVQVATFSSQVVLWLPLLGMVTGLVSGATALFIMAASWGIIMLFNLITLPVEFDASRRAKAILGHMGFIQPGGEAAAVNRMLNAAAWTYVAALLTSIAYFLWHLLPLLGGRRN